MNDLHDERGILYPAALPTFQRREVPEAIGHLARWYWISQWSLLPGASSTQTVLPFPAANLVVQPEGVTLTGATTAISSRELTGRGWAFGVLLRPAGLVRLGADASEIVDTEQPYAADALADAVRAHMDASDVAGAAEAMSRWWSAMSNGGAAADPDSPDPDGQRTDGQRPDGPDLDGDSYGPDQAERLIELAAADPGVVDVPGLAAGLGMSVRAVQRLARQYIGLSPLRIIRRYRLQEAALRLRQNPELTVARVAAELGYADQSHLAADFRTTLGLSPRDYRSRRQP